MKTERTERANGTEVDYFWTVVHELRQPLTSITGQVQLAKQFLETDPPRAIDALDHVVTQITRIDRLLIELHDRAREHVTPSR